MLSHHYDRGLAPAKPSSVITAGSPGQQCENQPFSYEWVLSLGLGEPIAGLPKAEQLTRVAASAPVNTGPKANSPVSRKKQQGGWARPGKSYRVTTWKIGRVKGNVLFWRRHPGEDAHLEPPYCISSWVLRELSLWPSSYSPLVFPFPQK